MRFSLTRFLAIASLVAATATTAAAQSWPSQPIRIIVPFPPGGTTDRIIRLAQPHLQQKLGQLCQPIVVENRGGASGSIGTLTAVKSPPDGYTFLLVFDTHAVNPSLIPKLPYDTLKDLAPVMLIGTSPMVVTTHPASPYKSFGDVLKATTPPSYGTIGAGSLAHLAMSQISSESHVPMTHVPYRGGGPLVVDAIAGHVPLAIASVALLMPNIQAEQIKPIAVTSPERFKLLPDVPTMAEQGLSNFKAVAWWGVLAPARTPAPIVAKMHDAFAEALRQPSVKSQLEEAGLTILASDSASFGDFLETEVARWGKVVKDNHITISP
jgi:tripartite-type tricarboxylate transporter receptor subunit TctC